MDLSGQASQARFASYVAALVEVIGHADRAGPLNDYCVGLLMPGERKSVEPMAAIVAPARVSAKHQSLLHLVGQAPWSDEAVLQKIRELVLPGIERQGRIAKPGSSMTPVLRRRARIHHHATLCIAAYGFLISERDAIPPSASRRRTKPRLPDGYRPRGAADPFRTPRRELDSDDQKTPPRRARKIPRAMSMLSVDAPTTCNPIALMTQ